MTITVNQNQNVQVLHLNGKLTIGYDMDLRNKVMELVDAGNKNFVIDLKQVPRMDSSGMGMLINIHVIMNSEGGRLILCEANSQIIQLLELAQLDSILEIVSTEQEAVSSF